MSDYIVRAMAAENAIRAFAINSKDLVEEGRKHHNTAPVMTAALGRLLTAGAMMGIMMKGDKDVMTLQIIGDGPGRGVTVTSDSKGHVKGYVSNPDVELPPNAVGKLDVGGAIGAGSLRVIKDLGLKEPYVGQTELISGEIAEDLTYYFAVSEQVPSSVGLGVLVDTDCSVKQAGGFIIQLLPFASDEVITKLEEGITSLPPVTTMQELGYSPERILKEVLKNFDDLEITETLPVSYKCDCSKERVTRALISVGRKSLQEMIDDNEPITINCQFCSNTYVYDVDELKEILKCSTAS